MDEFFSWLENETKMHPVELASEVHYRLVTIHPFIDGNGRTARLLMNMILMMKEIQIVLELLRNKNLIIFI